MKQANLIIGSKEVLATLNRTAAARIKADGENCSHLMHEIGMTDEEGYDELGYDEKASDEEGYAEKAQGEN